MHTEGQNPSEGIAPLVSAPRTSGNLLSAHTAGPWEVKELMGHTSVQAKHRGTIGLPHSTGYVVIATPAPYGREYAAEREATVRLVSAAPELLAAAHATQALLQAMKESDLSVRPSLAFAILAARDAAHAAITKATQIEAVAK